MLLKDQLAVIAKHQEVAPVPVVPIALDLGLKVYRVSSWPNSISGMLRRTSADRCAIFVNANHPETRRRFTIAHEIAHYVLHLHLIQGDGIVEDALLRAAGLSSAVEAQANAFAADILMPWKLINDQQSRGVNTIEELAQIFNVSLDAMSIRLIGLSYDRSRELGAAE